MGLDAVIIGSGAGAGPLALKLSLAGLKVLVLEKGRRLSREDYAHTPATIEDGLFTPDMSDDPHMVVTKKTVQPIRSHLGWVASCVGGGTEHMGAYLYRFHAADFEMRTRFGDRDGLADWPYRYDDLEPYYREAEDAVGVSGLAGANPFEGPRSGDYPMPPLTAHPIADAVEAACAARGLTAFPTPRAVNSTRYNDREACRYCETCAGYGCPVGARGSSQEALLARAEATGNCTVQAQAMVSKITTNDIGEATGCRYQDEQGNDVDVQARMVFVCCSAVESARLLLLSKSDRFPNGLANENGLVGKNLQFHAVTMGQGLIDDPGHDHSTAPPFIGRSVMDHYFLPDTVSTLAKGGILRFGFVPRAHLLGHQNVAAQQGGQNGAQAGPPHPNRAAERGIYFEVFHDFLPSPDCHVSLDPVHSDKWGLPCARIALDIHPHHKIAGRWLGERGCEILRDIGARQVGLSDIGGTSSYLVMGTCRAGEDPQSSVLDPYCRAHNIPNLYVVDGSFMPTSGGAPPTLTILANSFRVADHVLKHAANGGSAQNS